MARREKGFGKTSAVSLSDSEWPIRLKPFWACFKGLSTNV